MAKESGKSFGVWGFMSVLVVAVAASFIVYLFTNQDDTNSNQQIVNEQSINLNEADQTTSEKNDNCPTGYVQANEVVASGNYETLGLKFCYPQNWGDTIFVDEEEPLKSGMGHSITFSNKAGVGATIRTTDWETDAPRGGAYFDAPTIFSQSFIPQNNFDLSMMDTSAVVESRDNYLVTAYCNDFLGAVGIDALIEVGGNNYDAMKFYYLYRQYEEDSNGDPAIDWTGCDDVKSLVSPASVILVDIAKSIEIIGSQ